MLKLRVKGLGNLILKDEIPKLDKDYLLSVRISRSGKYTDEKEPENPVEIYTCEVINVEALQEIGTRKKLKVEKSGTWSQKIRFALWQLADKKNIDRDDYYEEEQKKRLNQIYSELEE